MKVVCISIVPSPYQRDLFKSLSEKADITVFYLEAESPDSPWPKKPLESFESILPGTYLSFRGMRFFINWKIPDLKDADFVILNGYMGTLFQWLLRVKSNKFIFWGEQLSDQPPGLKGKIHHWLSNVLKNCVAIVAIGTRAKAKYESRFTNVPVFNIPYYCSLESFQKLPLKMKGQQLNLLFCGQMIYRKGLDVLLKAFGLLSNQYNVVLHLVGREADLSEMMSTILDAESRRKVIYHGFQAPEKLPEFFNRADVFILPSRYDGWGVVINQALGAGLPIICSDQVGAGLDLIDEGKNGYRFRSGDAEDLYSKLKFFLDNPELISSMSKCSREKSLEMTPEKGSEKWLQVFNKMSHKQSVLSV